jgi:methionyl-tRNA formyltransferase
LRVAFAGTPEFALPALAALRGAHEVVGVLTQPDRPAGRGRQLARSAVKVAALEAHLPLAQPATLRSAEARAALAAWDPQVLVVVAYGLVLPSEVLTLPPLGCVNIHASLLPRWRGAAPIQRAILAGDAESGVTLMQMDAGLDTGPILLQRRLAIAADATAGSLHDALARLGAAALLEALEGLAAGSLRATPQPQAGATYAAKIAKGEARIDWAGDARQIERQIRAFNPWPVAQTTLDGETLRILAARAEPGGDKTPLAGDKSPQHDDKRPDPGTIVSVNEQAFTVRCERGTLNVTQVQRPGRRAVSASDFAHAVKLPGRHLG